MKAYRAARAAWAELARRAESVYARDITFGPDRYQRGHWLDRLPAIEQDVDKMAKLLEKPTQEAKSLCANRQHTNPTRQRGALAGASG